MERKAVREAFLESAKEWICDRYSLGVHFLATSSNDSCKIIDALIFLHPIPPERDDSFMVRVDDLVAGRFITSSLNYSEIYAFIDKACNGILVLPELTLEIEGRLNLDFYSEIPKRDSGFFELHLLATGAKLSPESAARNTLIDDKLRVANPPFDGLSDLCSWLQLTDTRQNGQSSGLNIRIGPPADIHFESTSIHGNKLQTTILSHASFDHAKLELVLREFPGNGIATRRHVTHLVRWSRSRKGQILGKLKTPLKNANSVLLMLMVGGRSVRRRWFDDLEKATHSRYIATQLFDKDLKQLKFSALESTDSVKFEQSIASILFLMGFSPAVQVETDAPDLIVTTPGGKLVIIECTLKVADFHNKLGKLVDRKNALTSRLESTGHNVQIAAFLACGAPRNQVALDEKLLAKHQITLLTRDELTQAFDQIRTPGSPDELIDRALAKLNGNQRILHD